MSTAFVVLFCFLSASIGASIMVVLMGLMLAGRDDIPQEMKNPEIRKTASKWCPDFCPITLRAFFMWIDHPDLGEVPTYGGPFDSYTIPEPDGELAGKKRQDIEYVCYRFDHVLGGWVGQECVEERVVSEEMLLNLGAWGKFD